MLTSIRSLPRLVGAATLALTLAAPSFAGDFTGLDAGASTLYDVDTGTSAATLIGPITGAPPFGFHSIARSPVDGSLYALAPGLISGYSIYSIDENTNTATLLHSIAAGTAGTVGMAVDPSGTTIWVAGFVSLSFNVIVAEIDIGTGVMTPRGNTGGNMSGLAFDGAGDLFTVILNSATQGIVIKIDQIDAAVSTLVGNTSGPDLTNGIALTSDLGSGSVHLMSRLTSILYTLDTTNAATAIVTTLTGASSVFNMCENLPVAAADDFVGLDAATSDLYTINSGTSTATLLGPITGGPAFGFFAIDRSSDGKLYGVAPGLIGGYSLYEIDEQALTANQLWSFGGSSNGGNVGIAVDPSGNSIWVAGFQGFSLNVNVHEVNIATGVSTPHGQTGGNMWGLAFDGNGDLFTTLQGATDPELIKIDKIDAAVSVLVGTMTGVDFNFGLDLSSDVTTGALHVISRNTDIMYSVNTTTAAATAISGPLAGGSNVFSIADAFPPCTLVSDYGAGCAGAGGFVPSLAFNGCPAPSASISVDIAGGVGGAMAAILLGSGQGSTPIGAGCDLLLTGVSPVTILVPLGGAGNGNGNVSIATTLPASLPSGSFTMQAFCADGTTGIGFTVTNGVLVNLP